MCRGSFILSDYTISSRICVQWIHVGGLKSATVGVFAPWKLANTPSQGLFVPGELVVKHLPAYCCVIKISSNLRQNLPVKLNGYSGTELPFLLSLATLVSQLRCACNMSSSVTVECASLMPTSATISRIARTAAMNILAVRWFPCAGSGC